MTQRTHSVPISWPMELTFLALAVKKSLELHVQIVFCALANECEEITNENYEKRKKNRQWNQTMKTNKQCRKHQHSTSCNRTMSIAWHAYLPFCRKECRSRKQQQLSKEQHAYQRQPNIRMQHAVATCSQRHLWNLCTVFYLPLEQFYILLEPVPIHLRNLA